MPAFTTNQMSQVPGTVSRMAALKIEPQVILPGFGPVNYGMPVVVDTATGYVRGIQNGDTADVVSGIVARPYVTTTQNVVGSLLTSNVAPADGSLSVLRMGYISVRVQGAATPVRNGLVYVRVANPPANSVIGGIEAAADGANTITLAGDTYFFSNTDYNGFAEIHFMSLRNSAGGGPTPPPTTYIPFMIFTSSATASAGQVFTNSNLSLYNNVTSNAIVVVNGSTMTPTVAYTISGNQLTILDWLTPNSVVQVEARGAPTSLAASTGFIGPFTSSATPSAGQTFTAPNIANYNNDATLAIVVVNGAVLTPNIAYTFAGSVMTILDWLDANSVVQIESK